jgi:tungstate transport system substrate-binding protein
MKGACDEKTMAGRLFRFAASHPGLRNEAMLNFMSLIPVNAAKFWRVNGTAALQFVYWMTAVDKGQKIIRDFGKDKYGAPMFFPNSDAWRKKTGK